MVGFVIETVLLSLILAERINRERSEKETAQQQILKLRESSNQELEKTVKLQTAELRTALASLEQANHELAELSITDPLTGLANRRHYEQVFAGEIQRAGRSNASLSLLIVDIDYFKQINDVHGHLAGDHCLKQVAQTLMKQVSRASDFAARFGGEEFAFILPFTDQHQAVNIAEKIRRAC